MKETIYPQRSQVVKEIFSRETRFNKILIVPLDHAKASHTVQLCFATGEFVLKKAFTVYNDPRGVQYLVNRIVKVCKKYHIRKENVVICCEDPPDYMVNFIYSLRLQGYQFISVNATEASKFRSNNRASSDELDLTGIAQAVINRKAMDIEPVDKLYSNLKAAGRNRRKLVMDQTAIKNRIHKSIDILFPGFLSEKNSGLTPFSEVTLWLMEKNFSAIKIRRMPRQTLESGLKRFRVSKVEKVIDKLKAYAASILMPPPEIIAYQQKSLATKIKLFRALQESAKTEENEAARYLVQSPGLYVLSIPGIGVKYASHIIGEYGNPATWRNADQMASYAGIVSRQKQTGGEKKKAPRGQHLPADCNKILKDYLLQAGQHTGKALHPLRKVMPSYDGTHTLQEHFQHVENNEGKSRLRNAKCLIKIIRRLVKEQRFYYPEKHWLEPSFLSENDEHILLFANTLQSVKNKLKGYDLSGIKEKDNYLIKEEKVLNALIEYKNNSNSK